MAELVDLVHPWVDATHAPLYTVVFPREADDAEVASFGTVREEWARRARYPVVWVVDLSNLVTATPKQRRMFSEHLERFEPHDIAFNRGSALVVPNAVLRGVVTAVFWLKRPRFPNECFPTLIEARKWAAAQLRRSEERGTSPRRGT